MDLFSIIFEGILCLLDLLLAAVDLYAWIKGKRNRVERREARKAGAEIPPRDEWHGRVVVLTVAVCLLTLVLLAWVAARILAKA